MACAPPPPPPPPPLVQAPPVAKPSVPTLAPVEPRVVRSGSRQYKRIALTFDACTTHANEYDGRVIDALVAARVPATIFIGGRWAQNNVDHVKALAANPLFEIGNHTFTHPKLLSLDEAQIRDDIARTQAELLTLTGKLPLLFRPPFGEYDERAARVAASLGLTTVQFDLPSGDPSKRATKERLIWWVLSRAQPGSIVVMHMNHKNLHTAEALPQIISGLRQRGYELVTVGALMAQTASKSVVARAAPPPR
jgi:peptidoglycan/xylan/chitin deacetylase (PgdA/CDA1 family)